MIIDILDLRRSSEKGQTAVDIAFPVVAVECEAAQLLEDSLDAYEEAALRLIALGLSAEGVAKALNATASLVEEILSNLQEMKYVDKKPGSPWKLTGDGQECLDGTADERVSDERVYGYMFINAIKKEVLPYFYEGDIGRLPLFESASSLRLTVDQDEKATFSQAIPEQSKLVRAYREYFRNLRIANQHECGELSGDEAADLIALQPMEDDADEKKRLKKNMYVRALRKRPTFLYLRMGMVFDPGFTGGYRIESPFDMGGIDDLYFKRQMQWLEQSDRVFLGEEPLSAFLRREICKLLPDYEEHQKDLSVFMLEHLPRLGKNARFSGICQAMELIYPQIQTKKGLIDKEHIVSDLSRYVVEPVFDMYFAGLGASSLRKVANMALEDIKVYGNGVFRQRLCQNTAIGAVLPGSPASALKHLYQTHGNSIMEKFVNMLAIDYYLGEENIHRFLSLDRVPEKCRVIKELSDIRNKVSHNTNAEFTDEDYDHYISEVFKLIDCLAEGLEEA